MGDEKKGSHGIAHDAQQARRVWLEQRLELRLVLSEECKVPLDAQFTYASHEPYAVRLVFHLETQEPVHWVFARDLLTEGMTRMTGHADVRVWPSPDESTLCLLLESQQGRALLEAPAANLGHWLALTHEVVPTGQEGRFLDVDSVLEQLLPTPGASGPGAHTAPNEPADGPESPGNGAWGPGNSEQG
ncbi:SsgA family sporulation/cell division regulator [Streptomyces oceani]|uniref:SsgA family sporulation/cell division regulator n=1 Tax=Streptomyces oceani TaxID=1075402 RepID=UPI0008734B1E|nr:SsgA family sporulation/cell division regulator [Streptomyces oceani]